MIKSNRSKLEKVYKDIAMKRLIKAGRFVEKQAKVITAVDTGKMKASVTTNWTGGKEFSKVGKLAGKARLPSSKTGRIVTSEPVKGIRPPTTPFTVIVGSNAKYSPFVELGTSKMSAQPFLRPALFGSKSAIGKIMGGG
ncbi:HK97 gp10 family phage protein [Candidatus Pacearchaeota archaeon]|nr:HK97 gp10 family phage protein [Candidatus Pacearchaeota archaeon]